ncbi:ARID DNA-binding domain-containing protein [Tanacetum coccineum]
MLNKYNWLRKEPVKQWYQSLRSNPWEKPVYEHDREGVTSRYLQRETPQRQFPWNCRKKKLSPEGREILKRKVKEIEAFNASKTPGTIKESGKGSINARRDKRARCYRCKIRGHVYWKCPNKLMRTAIKNQKGKGKMVMTKAEETVDYPEQVHIITDYMIEGSDRTCWDNIWYVSSAYKHHMCPTRLQFKRLKYKFEMIEKEEIEKKFIFSYGIGDIIMETKKGQCVISDVHYTPEITLNVLSYDLLEEQGYIVDIGDNKCNIRYMFGKGTWKAQEEIHTKVAELNEVITQHNKYLQKYFESLEQKDEESCVKGLEDLKWDRDDVHDYIDDEYISWNGSLYALKVNSFSRFLSFLKLIKKDGIVYEHWEIISRKYVEMLKWFYLVYLNYDTLEIIPPLIGMKEIDLLCLHKAVDKLGGYQCVTLDDGWKIIANMLGLAKDDGEALRECYKKFIDMVDVYYETAQKPWYEKVPGKDVIDSSVNAKEEGSQGKRKVEAEIRETLGEMSMNRKTRLGVILEGNTDDEEANQSTTDSNDFVVIT